jgi:UDP-N-acetylglucosamine--N-acetylmuramyl-(pentapeptide) pyrophosphoryl-undecaprenol N-acetylglucosamine transferase
LTKILYGVSPIGLGHASRAVAVGLKLREKGLEPEFATGGRAVSFIQSFGFKVRDVISEPVPFESRGKILFSGLWYVRYWFGYRASYSRMEEVIAELKPGLIVGDEEFSEVSIALKKGIEHALVSDELELKFAKSFLAEMIERRVRRWYSDLQKSVSHLIIPDFGEDSGNIHFVTPIVREVTKDRADVLAEFNLPSDKKMVVFSKSGSGRGKFLEERTIEAFENSGLRDSFLAISGGAKAPRSGAVFRLGFIPDNQNIVAAADLVISSAGKSTIDEAQSYGTPIIAIPFKDHFEQERNARNLGFSFEDIDRLETLIPEYAGKRSEPRKYGGAEKAAALLSKLS